VPNLKLSNIEKSAAAWSFYSYVLDSNEDFGVRVATG
jgi:hypothetical protein